MLHLHAQPDQYPQYAHLHWHTVDPIEVGKYAKLRSKEEFGSHVATDPEPIDWLPASDNLHKLTYYQRNRLFSLVLHHKNEITEFLQDTPDYAEEDGHTLWDTVKHEILATFKPKQMEGALDHVKKLLEEYKASGVTVTREKMAEHVHLYLMSQLTHDQASHLSHALEHPLDLAGLRNPLNDD